MANKKLAEFKVGLFVFIAALVVILAIFWAKGFTVGLAEQDYIVYFSRVSGINEGDQVSVNGVRKGKIDKIMLEGDSVKIAFTLDKTVQLRKDYNIYVAATELTGGKVLYIEPGISSDVVSPETPLHGNPGADFASLMNSFGEIANDVKGLIGEFKKSTDNLNIVLNNVNEIVGDQYLKGNLRTTLSNLASSSANLNKLVNDSRSGIGKLTDKAGTTFENIDNMVGENGVELKNTLREIQSLTNTVDTLAFNLAVVVGDIKDKKQGIGKFLTDDKFFNNMNKTLLEIEKLTKNIRTKGIKLNLF